MSATSRPTDPIASVPDPRQRCEQERLLAVLDASRPGAWERVGGVPLCGRVLYHLGELNNIERVILLLGPDGVSTSLARWQRGLKVKQILAEPGTPAQSLRDIVHGDPSVLYVDASHLIDPRLLRALAAARRTTLVHLDGEERERVRAGRLSAGDIKRWTEEGARSLWKHATSLSLDDIDAYVPAIRGPLRPYFMEVRSRGDARKATWVLIRSQQKQVMELPAQYLDPTFENGLTRLLCETPVTPNMITLTATCIALGIAWLFWHGNFVAGAFGTFLVEVLDGVDGKLARTKLQFTRLGEYEHLLDYFFENSWYVALAMGLSVRSPNLLPAYLGGLLVLSDTADNLFYTLASRWFGRSIDLFSRFDRAFRRIAGRRNIYGFLFMIGFPLGYTLETFAVASAWAFLTATVHGVRLLQIRRKMKKDPKRVTAQP